MKKEEELSKEGNNQEKQEVNSEELNKDKDSPSSKDIQDNKNIIQNDNLLYEDENPQSEEKVKLKPSAYSSTQKTKSRIIEENKEISDFTTNKKFRNTISGLNSNKLKFQSGLKGDLAEMYKDINRDYTNFKNNVFLANIDYFEKKTGNLDKNPKRPYHCSEDISFKLDKYPTTNEIIDKFAERTKNYKGDI